MSGKLYPAGSMFLRVDCGEASAQDGTSYAMTHLISGEPLIRSNQTEQYFLLPWPEVIALAREAGIDETPMRERPKTTLAQLLGAVLGCAPENQAILAAINDLQKARYERRGEYFLLSLKHSHGKEVAVWWRPESRGYTPSLADAGIYTAEEVAELGIDGISSVAIPLADAIKAGLAVVPLKQAKALAERQVPA